MLLSGILSFGYLPAVFVTGHWLTINIIKLKIASVNPVSRWALFGVFGILIGTVISFALALADLFHAPSTGAFGWLITASHVLTSKRSSGPSAERWRPTLLLCIAFALFAFNGYFASESIQAGRDQGTYSLHGANIAKSGNLDVPLAFEGLELSDNSYRALLYPSSPLGFAYDLAEDRMQAQFPPTLALNLAQFYGFFGYETLFLCIPFIASINLLLIYAIARTQLSWKWAFLIAVFFALNPAQLWNSRITLSEILAQAFILSGFLLTLIDEKEKRTATYLCGIAMLACSSLVRVDCFLLATIIPFAHFLRILLSPTLEVKAIARKTHLANAILATLTTASWFYYQHTTPRYFGDFETKVGLFILAGVSFAVASWALASIRSKLGLPTERLFSHKFVWGTVAVLVVVAVAYAFFLRPHIEPFSQFEDSNYGTRNYRENTLHDLAAYISYPLILLAIFGYIVILKDILVKRDLRLLLFLAAWSAFSLAYLQDPRISPDHIWRIRRFTPLIIPGFILIGFIGITKLPLRKTISQRLLPMCYVASTFFILHASWPLFLLKENKGMVEVTRAIANEIPDNALVLSDISRAIRGVLYVSEGKHIVAGNTDRSGQIALLNRAAREATERGESVFLLTSQRPTSDAFPAHSWRLRYPYLKPTYEAPARVVEHRLQEIHLIQIDGEIRPFEGSEDSIVLGSQRILGVTERGFFGQEFSGQSPFRWTAAEASLRVPWKFKDTPVAMTLKLGGFNPDGTSLTLSANGKKIFSQFIAPKTEIINIPVNQVDWSRQVLDLQLNCDPWVPSKHNRNTTDSRQLGLQVYGVTIKFQNDESIGGTIFGNIPNKWIQENGLHDIENIDGASQRWTNGDASFQFELKKRFYPNALLLDLSRFPPHKKDFTIYWNDQAIFSGEKQEHDKPLTIPLSDELFRENKTVTLRILSDTFIPAEIEKNSNDHRRLGVMIRSIQLK